MQKVAKINRILYMILCFLNLASIFYAIMLLCIGTPLYGFFRQLSLCFSFPLTLLRLAYLQYILLPITAIVSVLSFLKHRHQPKAIIMVDVALWILTVFELVFLERTFNAFLWF